MKNILFVVDEKKMGGVSILLEDIINKINRKQMNIDVLVLHNNGEMLDKFNDEVKVIYGSPYFEAVDYSLKDLIKSFKIRLLFKKIRLILDMKTGYIKKKIIKERKKLLTKKYDTEIAFKDGFTALFTAYGDSSKKIHWLHYEYSKINPNGRYKKVFKDALSKFELIVSVNENVKNCFQDIYNLNCDYLVIPNLIDIERIKKNSDINLNDKINHDKINFISVGRLHYVKGYDRLLEAITRLNNEGLLKNCLFEIYGDGPEYSNLLKQVEQNNLENIVEFKGKTFNPYSEIRKSDIFILSSVAESFGLVIVEAMVLGIPVLATSNAATSELINDGVNGIIVNNSVDGLYNGLKEIISNPKIINEMKEKLINYEYPVQDIIEKIEGVLKD